MRELSELEALIYNDGERLIPAVTHDRAEEVRHRSSYALWRTIIELDLDTFVSSPSELRVADLGCGVGHGCANLAELPGASIVGVGVSEESLDYARSHYARDNVEYVGADLREFIPRMSTSTTSFLAARWSTSPTGSSWRAKRTGASG